MDPSLHTRVRLESSASMIRLLECDVTLELYHSYIAAYLIMHILSDLIQVKKYYTWF